MYSDYRDAQREWDQHRWPSFSAKELACPLTDELYIDPHALDCLQSARKTTGKPFTITSAHRSPAHNKVVGGAPRSAHLQIAFDISLRYYGQYRHDRFKLKENLANAGFTRFGLYETFIHVDTRMPVATWYGPGGANAWNPDI